MVSQSPKKFSNWKGEIIMKINMKDGSMKEAAFEEE